MSTVKEAKEERVNQIDETLDKVTQLLKAAKEPNAQPLIEQISSYKPPEIVEETNTVSSY